MCGIAGLLKMDGSPANRDLAQRMISTLRHRGPDDCGVHIDGPVGLSHARLSIIDLAGGAQPMSSVDGRLCITFNGEIFNFIELREELLARGHRFSTKSDTEVILNAYREFGEDCVHHFNGQWAFAIWDAHDRRLFLARDRMGIRPLYYTRRGESFFFASEVKALFACPEIPREIDLQGLDQIFTFWVTLPPKTAFRGVSQLPPGCCMTVVKGDFRVRQYWSLSYDEDDRLRSVPEDRLAGELLSLLEDATRIRLRADVPVGAYLSGGIDSTVTAALAKNIVHERLRTFSITFEDTEFDEQPYQREASAFLGTQHSNVSCSCSDIARIFPEVIRHTEQPIIRTAPAPMYLLSKLVRDNGYKVVLTGEGADEILGGYDIFKEAKIRAFWARHPDSQWRPLLLRRLYPYMENIQRQPAAYLRHFFRVTPEDLTNPFFSHLPRWDLTAKLKLLLSEDARKTLRGYDSLAELQAQLPPSFAQWTYFGRAEHLEEKYLMPGYILSSQGDRMAMAHSVEGRYPFLDYRVVQFAAKLPAHLKMKALDQKHLLKVAVRGKIPDSILRRPKQPYRAPDGKCFLGAAVVDYAEEMLSRESLRNNGLFDPRAVGIMVDKFTSNRATGVKDNMALIGVLSTQLLVHQFIHSSAEDLTPCSDSILSNKSAVS
ncbi:MAG TPA: asparagine synthase (glutamine-hydrolyzing) [Acidobacteriaceae bacterium]